MADENNAGCIGIIALSVCALMLLGKCGGGGGDEWRVKHNREVYSSAMNKLDSDRPLNAEEQQMVGDVINWCQICNKPLRQCPHGK